MSCEVQVNGFSDCRLYDGESADQDSGPVTTDNHTSETIAIN